MLCPCYIGKGVEGGAALQRHNTENSKQIFPEKEQRGLSPSFYIHVNVSDFYSQIRSTYFPAGKGRPIVRIYKSLTVT
jgi:hypothetical protein